MNVILYAVFLVLFEGGFGQEDDLLPHIDDSHITAHNENDTEIVRIQEVEDGKNAVLVCHSNDREHLFLFWQLAKDDTVVGPGNPYDMYKYDYEILSGNLVIKAVSSDEEGMYHCVSRGVRHDDINIRSIRMVVKRDWEEVDEHDPGLNYFRGVIVLLCLMAVAGAGYFVYKLKRRHRLESLLEAESDEEDSNEEIFRTPGTSGQTGNIVRESSSADAEIPKISIDFEDILKNSGK